MNYSYTSFTHVFTYFIGKSDHILQDTEPESSSHLPLCAVQVGDVVQLLYRVSDDWLFGRCGPKEGMFPQCFIKVRSHSLVFCIIYSFHVTQL